MRVLVFALAALLLAAATCSRAPQGGAEPPAAAAPAAEDSAAAMPIELLEAVFRYQFEHNASAVQHSAAAYCLSLGEERSVPEALLQRFAGHRPPVHAAADCPAGEGVLTFRVVSVRWLSADEVEAVGGYHEGNLSSSTESYRAVREAGAWRVVESRLLVIS